MSEFLFDRIHDSIKDPEHGSPLFMGHSDAVGRKASSSLQRMISVLKQLAYGTCANANSDYTGVRKKLGRECLYEFCEFIIKRFGPEYLGKWDKQEMLDELAANEKRGFPGMIGSIDCCHWVWHRRPIAWQGMYLDRNHKRSIVVEAIAGHDTYFSQAFVGLPGSLNDINIMGRTDLRKRFEESHAIEHVFSLDGEEFTGAYLLADGIYPPFPYLMKTISMPIDVKQRLFAKMQEGFRKDVERAFGRLHAKWHILKFPGMCNKVEHLNAIWLCCIILHNMTLRDQLTKEHERTHVTVYPASVAAMSDIGNMEPVRDAAFFEAHSAAAIMARRRRMEDSEECQHKQRMLVEHVHRHLNPPPPPLVPSPPSV